MNYSYIALTNSPEKPKLECFNIDSINLCTFSKALADQLPTE